MIDLVALKRAGLDNDVLKRIFTAQPTPGTTPPSAKGKKITTGNTRGGKKAANAYDTTDTVGDTPRNPDIALSMLETLPDNPTDWEVRRWWERRLTARVQDGLYRNTADFNKWAAIDLAYASTPIHPTTLPLMQVAQGHISLDQCSQQIAALSTKMRDKLFVKDTAGKLTGIKAPELVEVSHNLVHSLVTRRVAAVATEIEQMYPLMEYDTFSNAQSAKLRGDVMTQIAEQMAGTYGYRHDAEESIRAASLYSQCIKFKANAWHTEYQTLPQQATPEPSGAKAVGQKPETKYKRQLVREGVLFTLPHPSRTYYDTSRPVSRINYGTGPQYIGHWDVIRIGELQAEPAYFNKDAVFYDAVIYKFFAAQFAYMNQYFPDRMVAPITNSGSAGALALTNDRVAQIGAYASLRYDMSTTIAYHYEEIIPKNVGLGTYEDPVWIRFCVAGNRTVIYAEIVGSAPASYNGYNTSDNLMVSPSFAMLVLPYQEQITNLLTTLLRTQYQGFCRIWALNTHGMDKKDVDALEQALQYPDYTSAKDIIIKYDAALLQDRGQDPKTISQKITQIQIETKDKITEIFSSIVQLLSIAERLLFFSPQELGQVAPRTITAFEAKMVNTTTLGIRDFGLTGIKQQIDADKRIVHDSYMAFGSEDLEVPVASRYDAQVIEDAGFEIIDDGKGNPDGLFTIRGKKLGLLYNYIYTIRNTDDLPTDAAEAQALGQVYDIISKDPILSAAMGIQDRVDLANRFIRHITGEDFKITLDPAKVAALQQAQPPGGQPPPGQPAPQSGAAPAPQGQPPNPMAIIAAMQDAITKVGQQVAQLGQQTQQNQASITALAQALQKFAQQGAAANSAPLPQAGPGTPGPNEKTHEGQIAPGMPIGSGAPPLKGVIPVPNEGPQAGP